MNARNPRISYIYFSETSGGGRVKRLETLGYPWVSHRSFAWKTLPVPSRTCDDDPHLTACFWRINQIRPWICRTFQFMMFTAFLLVGSFATSGGFAKWAKWSPAEKMSQTSFLWAQKNHMTGPRHSLASRFTARLYANGYLWTKYLVGKEQWLYVIFSRFTAQNFSYIEFTFCHDNGYYLPTKWGEANGCK